MINIKKKYIICFDIDNMICKTKKIITKPQNPTKKQSEKSTNYMKMVTSSNFSLIDIWLEIKKI